MEIDPAYTELADTTAALGALRQQAFLVGLPPLPAASCPPARRAGLHPDTLRADDW
jgi:hypothetical protein